MRYQIERVYASGNIGYEVINAEYVDIASAGALVLLDARHCLVRAYNKDQWMLIDHLDDGPADTAPDVYGAATQAAVSG